MTCSACGQRIVEGQAAIFGMDNGAGKLIFGWTCCHKPVGNVAVILASNSCMEKWLTEHPEYFDAVGKVFEAQHAHSK